ncbi:uncharacterized protein LOC128859140 [Anastrepha ludens]|uniref:uncharacterized protein LOC128859140 n=1 Tax=Anastrepha ludens TaxID=28586 RepID=UPI0023B044BC|nr:uncharacterized protein LOC128859140 [Anastrepha ludens]XP_053951865.1 uncharacterized protein LOC128859140 [Anastrepha ludens]
MLKHASNAGGGGGPANGQLRNNPSNTNATVASNRSIHLRPQQPLNISTLSATQNALQTSSTSAIANGGQRIPTLLNIASTPISGGTTNTNAVTPLSPSAANTTTTTTPVTPLTPNGIANNLHTYTNQHILACSNNNNNNNNTHNTATSAVNNNTHNNNHNYSNCHNITTGVLINQSKHGPGPREALTSLGLLCLVSLLLALLSLIFLLKISPNAREDALTRSSAEDFVIVYDVTLALCALSLSLNLCCLLVCAIQFLFAVKLVRSPMFDGRDNKYLEKSSASRTCAVGGFFISIPIFLTGIILYTFNHFHSTPAIITSVLIGIGIVFCGGAMVHNVFIWQKEKTISYRSPPLNMSMMSHIGPITPPTQFLSPHHTHHFMNYAPQMHAHTHSTHAQPQTQLGVASTGLHPTSVTPVSPNHSHGSFNALLSAGALNSSFLMRPSTATPPTPKPLPTQLANGGGCLTLSAREASGSVSPGIPGALDMSNITSPSLHELSTLV